MLFNRGRNHLQFIVGISPVSPQIHLKAIGNLESGKISVAKYTTHNMERAGRYNFRSYHWLVKPLRLPQSLTEGGALAQRTSPTCQAGMDPAWWVGGAREHISSRLCDVRGVVNNNSV